MIRFLRGAADHSGSDVGLVDQTTPDLDGTAAPLPILPSGRHGGFPGAGKDVKGLPRSVAAKQPRAQRRPAVFAGLRKVAE